MSAVALERWLYQCMGERYGGQHSILVAIDGKTLRGPIIPASTAGGFLDAVGANGAVAQGPGAAVWGAWGGRWGIDGAWFQQGYDGTQPSLAAGSMQDARGP